MTEPSRAERLLAAAKRAGAYAAPNGYYIARDRLRARRFAGGVRLDRHLEAFSYEQAIRFLVGRGLDEREVRAGSMPEASLAFALHRALDHLPADRPLAGLQVGNFVGVSLAYVSSALRAVHPRSVTVSVDPDMTHRGIAEPRRHVLALLGHFGLLANNLVVAGYSLERSWGEAPAEPACEQVLDSLATVCGEGLDLVLLDGHHAGEYLARELTALRPALRPGAVVVVDDVEVGPWDEVVQVFDTVTADTDHFEELGRDGRIGVLRLTTADQHAGLR